MQDRCDALVVFPDSAMYEVSDRIAQFAATEAVLKKLGTDSSYFPYQSESFLPARDLSELGTALLLQMRTGRARTLSEPRTVHVGSQAAFRLWLVSVCPKGIADDIRPRDVAAGLGPQRAEFAVAIP